MSEASLGDEPAGSLEQAVRLLERFGGEAGLQPILDGVRAAKSNKQIARDLGVTDKTVRNQLTRIFAKLGVSTRQEAILKLTGNGR